jgi:threonine dehydratase
LEDVKSWALSSFKIETLPIPIYTMTPTLDDIIRASKRISGQVYDTPIVHSPTLSEITSSDIYLKLECLQNTGSFKLRGATNAMMNLSDEQRECGVVCVSTGNHGRGLAFAAKQNNIKAIVCMGNLVPENKIKGIQALGAEVRIVGNNQDDAQVEADRLVAEEGMTMVPPFDYPDIIAGQGTIGLEIIDQHKDVDTVVVPLSGGGLCGGVALAVKSLSPSTQMIGVSMERGCAMHQSLEAGKPIFVEELSTLADSLGGGIGLDNEYTFNLVKDNVDQSILVSEENIADAIRHAYFKEQQIIEGSGSVGIAAALSGQLSNTGKTVIVVSGKNIDMNRHQDLMNGIMPDIY